MREKIGKLMIVVGFSMAFAGFGTALLLKLFVIIWWMTHA